MTVLSWERRLTSIGAEGILRAFRSCGEDSVRLPSLNTPLCGCALVVSMRVFHRGLSCESAWVLLSGRRRLRSLTVYEDGLNCNMIIRVSQTRFLTYWQCIITCHPPTSPKGEGGVCQIKTGAPLCLFDEGVCDTIYARIQLQNDVIIKLWVLDTWVV